MVTFVCDSVLTVTLLHFLSIKCEYFVPVLAEEGGGGVVVECHTLLCIHTGY